MSLNSEDIYNNIESFRNKHGLSQDRMAEIIGMSGKSAYSAMIKNKRMKFEYLINLINNSEMTIEQLFKESIKYEQEENSKQVVEEKSIPVIKYSCLDCIEKQNTINDLRANLKDLRRHIDFLEFSLGKIKDAR
jgi:DNA-binding XRE family transcriptional regulator